MSISLGLSTLSTLQELPDDFSPSQPRSNKHMKNNSITKFSEAPSSLLNITANNPSELSYHDLQTKYVMLSAEANRLLTNNLNLSSEVQTLEQRCHEAEKLVGRTITVTIDKNTESSQRGQIYELNDRLEMAKNIIVKQNKEIFALKNNTSIMTRGEDEEVWKQKYHDLETRFDQQAEKYHGLFLKLEKKLNETIETKNELIKQSEILTQQLQAKSNYTELSEEKESLEIQLDSCKIELETSKEEIEMLKREILRMRQQFLPLPLHLHLPADNTQKQVLIPNLNLQRANNINNFGKRFCLKFLKSIRGDDAVSEIDSFFDEQGKFTSARFHTSPEKITSNNFTYETLQEEEGENESLEKRYTAKDMNLLRKELIEYEQIIMFLSEQVKSSSDEKKLNDFIQQNTLETADENKKLLEEIKTYRDKISELEVKANTQVTCQSEETEFTIKLQQQIGEYQSKIIQLEQDKTNMKEDLKDNQLLIQAYVKENEKLQNLIKQYKSTDHQTIEEYEKTIQKLNQSIAIWRSEFQRLEKDNSHQVSQGNKSQHEKVVEILKQKFVHFEKSFDIVAKQNEDLSRKIKNLQQELTSSNQRITELTRENQSLNAIVTSKTQEIHDIISKQAQDEKMKEKWLHSYAEMEEIVTTLESRKESMQNQLNKMREIIESNNEEIFQLSEINQRQELQNQVLIQEIQRLQSSNKNHPLLSHKYC